MSKVDYTITKQLQDDLIEAYKKVAGKAWDYMDAFRQVAAMEAPRYYVTPKQAYQVVVKMMKGDFYHVDHMARNKRRMYYSLFNKVVELSEQRAFIDKSLWYIIHYATSSPAPEFFISPQRAYAIRHSVRQKTVDENGKPVVPRCQTKWYKKLKEKRKQEKERKMLS